MKTLTIKWQRLLADGQTCPRCGATETAIIKAQALLSQALVPLGISVLIEKVELSVEQFQQDPLQSNAIRLNERLLEDWLGATTGQSECCDVCGPNDCRTVNLAGDSHEIVPAELIVKGGLLAAAQLVDQKTCDCFPPAIWPAGGCCPQ